MQFLLHVVSFTDELFRLPESIGSLDLKDVIARRQFVCIDWNAAA